MTPLSELTDRRTVGEWLNKNNLVGEGVEIGVQEGENAENILTLWQGKTLHLVDPWMKWPEMMYQDRTNEIDFEAALAKTVERMSRFTGRSQIHRLPSAAAARMFRVQQKQFDFIYIDAQHSYESVTQDLRNWYPLVKPGGLFGGHDYLNRYDPAWICEVELAVEDRFGKVHVTQEEGSHPSWWKIKDV